MSSPSSVVMLLWEVIRWPITWSMEPDHLQLLPKMCGNK